MDLDVAMRSLECPYTVHFYGAMFRDGDVWICMEVLFEFRITMKYLLCSYAGYGHLSRSLIQKHESSGQFYARVRTSPGLYIAPISLYSLIIVCGEQCDYVLLMWTVLAGFLLNCVCLALSSSAVKSNPPRCEAVQHPGRQNWLRQAL